MNLLGRLLRATFQIVGAIVLLSTAALVIRRGVSLQDLLIVGLVLPTAWVRINLEPKGYFTLAPLAIFPALLLADTPLALFIAALSPPMSGLVSGQWRWESLEEAGAESAALLAGIFLVSRLGFELRTPGTSKWLEAFAIAAACYVCGRFVLAALDAGISQRIRFRAYAKSAGKTIAYNLTLLGALAVGVSYLASSYGESSSFILALATIAVVEAYYPFKQLSDQRDILLASLAMIAHAVDLKDAYTGKHARDASEIAVRIARALQLAEPEVWDIRLAGMLHDIGKLGVSTKIIRKPSSLTQEEMTVMRRHPVIGAEIMRPIELLADASDIVRHHHEHFDGSGYPDRLSGDHIPVGSRVVLVADAFNAITTDRSYRKARSKDEALEILKKHAGTQFDPSVVAALEEIRDLIRTNPHSPL